MHAEGRGIDSAINFTAHVVSEKAYNKPVTRRRLCCYALHKINPRPEPKHKAT